MYNLEFNVNFQEKLRTLQEIINYSKRINQANVL